MAGAAVRAEAQRLRAAFEAAGAVPVEADILQPAETLLDLYGEDIRSRAYVTQDPLRGEMMLRPDFTVPVVEAHMANGAEPARYAYMGEVFRKQEHRGPRVPEYVQVGYEVFDRADPVGADAEVFALFARLLSGLGLRAVTGDLGLLSAAVAGLSTTPARKAALMRHIWRPRRFRALLERFARKAVPPPARAALMAEAAAGRWVPAGEEIGLRSAAEVAERLARLHEDAAAPPLPEAEVALIDRILSVAAPLPEAARALAQVAADWPGDWPAIGAAVGRMEARMAALSARGVDLEALSFEAGLGRTTMEYYDGFVFSFVADRPDLPPVASGGRYDALTAVLGRGRSIPAVGGVIRPGVAADLGAFAGAAGA
jgi:ATP phosphoribosyltransferase regulatory subunit